MKLEIYHRKNAYNNELKRLEDAKISKRNKELILSYHSYLFSCNRGDLRVSKLSSILRRISEGMTKDFDEITKEDLILLVSKINRNTTHSDATKSDYRKSLKQFYQWFKEEDNRLETDNLKELREIQKFYKTINDITTTCEIKSIDYGDLLQEKDIDKVIDAGCKTYKEKALIKFLHETGCRVGELLNMKIKDIEYKENHALARLDGKTGERRVFVIHSLPLLSKWIDIHPKRDDPHSYLWLGENRNSNLRGKPLRHIGVQKLITRCFERCGLKKKHNPHWFRHSRATLLATKLTEQVLCKYMGWVLGSNQVKRYVHLCAQQVEDSFLELNGLIKKEDDERNPIKCSCGILNEFNSRYCFRCGKPMNVEIALQDEEEKITETNKTIQLLSEIMQNPEMFKQFQEFKKNMI